MFDRDHLAGTGRWVHGAARLAFACTAPLPIPSAGTGVVPGTARAPSRDGVRGPTAAVSPRDLVLERVTARRGGHTVLRDLSLVLPAGAITAVIGPSGVGKTTLMGLLNGLLRPSSGRVAVAGLGDLADPEVLREHRRRTGTIFQEYALIDRLPALDNVLLGLAHNRHPLSPLPWPAAAWQQAALALAQVGLLHRAGVRAGNLSGGERQRVAIARALIGRPLLVLGDEPFAAIDPALTRRFCEELRALAAGSGTTVVLVLHQIEVALRVADWLIGLRDGQATFVGPPAAFGAEAQAAIFDPCRNERARCL
jgi:phosphonate transport system ATP-binding protein